MDDRCSGCAYGLAPHIAGSIYCTCSCHLLRVTAAIEKATGTPFSEYHSRVHFAERQAAAVLLVNAGWSLSTVGRWLGYADHTTVRLATQTWREAPKVAAVVNKAAALLANDYSFESLRALRESLQRNFG